jgi:hypothetical protein
LEPNDSDGIEVGFVRTLDGLFESIRVPGAEGTVVGDINAQNTLLLSTPNGPWLRIDGEYRPLELCRPGDGVGRITDEGHLVGTTVDPALGIRLGLVQSARRYTTYRYPDATNTILYNVNSYGIAVGVASVPGRPQIGFVFVPLVARCNAQTFVLTTSSRKRSHIIDCEVHRYPICPGGIFELPFAARAGFRPIETNANCPAC